MVQNFLLDYLNLNEKKRHLNMERERERERITKKGLYFSAP